MGIVFAFECALCVCMQVCVYIVCERTCVYTVYVAVCMCTVRVSVCVYMRVRAHMRVWDLLLGPQPVLTTVAGAEVRACWGN